MNQIARSQNAETRNQKSQLEARSQIGGSPMPEARAQKLDLRSWLSNDHIQSTHPLIDPAGYGCNPFSQLLSVISFLESTEKSKWHMVM